MLRRFGVWLCGVVGAALFCIGTVKVFDGHWLQSLYPIFWGLLGMHTYLMHRPRPSRMTHG